MTHIEVECGDGETFKKVGLLFMQGKLAIFPAKTVYGLGVDAENESAVVRPIVLLESGKKAVVLTLY